MAVLGSNNTDITMIYNNILLCCAKTNVVRSSMYENMKTCQS